MLEVQTLNLPTELKEGHFIHGDYKELAKISVVLLGGNLLGGNLLGGKLPKDAMKKPRR